jgi:hypothetical protein
MRNTALVHLTKTLSDQLGPDGITVNIVHPRVTRTEHIEAWFAEMAAPTGTTVEAIIKREAADPAAIRRMFCDSEAVSLLPVLAHRSPVPPNSVAGLSSGDRNRSQAKNMAQRSSTKAAAMVTAAAIPASLRATMGADVGRLRRVCRAGVRNEQQVTLFRHTAFCRTTGSISFALV